MSKNSKKESFLLSASDSANPTLGASFQGMEGIEQEKSLSPPPNKCWAEFWNQVKQQSFMLGVFIAVGLAAVYPTLGAAGGPLQTEYSIKYGIVPFIFFIMGIALKTRELGKAVKDVKLNLTIQFLSLVFIPSFVYGIYLALQHSNITPDLLDGLVVLACLPVTTTTCNVLCKAADGNTAVSLFHSALGNLLGAFYTPAVVLLLLGNQSSVSFVDVLLKIVETLLGPLIAGQIVHNFFGNNKVVHFIQAKSGDVTKVCLLIIIWNTFCDTFVRKIEGVDTQDVVFIILLVISFHILFVVVAVLVFRQSCFHINRRTQVSAWFCSTQKTIVMGIPLVKIIFEGNPALGLIQIPLLMYHPTQTIGASFFLGKINKWVKKDDEEQDNEKTGLLTGKEAYGGRSTELPDDEASVDNQTNGLVVSSSSDYLGSSPSRSSLSIPATPTPASPLSPEQERYR